MGRCPVRSRDRLQARSKLFLASMLTCAALQTKLLFDALVGSTDLHSTLYAANLLQYHLSMSAQFGLLISVLAPLLRPKTRYSIGPERYSFERIEREFGDSTSCEVMFRFKRDDLRRLCTALKFPDVMRTRSRFMASGEEVFLYTLRRLSYPSTLATLSWESGRSTSAQSEMFDAGITHVYRNFAHLRDGRSLECWARHFQHFADAIHLGGRKGRVPLRFCIGFIDGTNQYVSHPHLNQGLLFNGHKRKHCVKWQGIMLPNGIMPMPYGPVSGSHHDSWLLDQSRVLDVMRRCCRGLGCTFQLYGDPAYPQSQYLSGPYRSEGLDKEEALFNVGMSSTRIANEWGFGKIKLLWAYLDFENGQKVYLNDVQKYWPVAQILANCHTCLYGSQTATYFKVAPPHMEDYLANRV
jgi:hypothetical protein